MLTLTVVGLGFAAGLTIYASMPIARMRRLRPVVRALLGALTAGILIFLFTDVVGSALVPVHSAVQSHNAGNALTYGLLVLGSFLFAIVGLAVFERLYRVPVSLGGIESEPATTARSRPPALGAMNLIAIGIGFHNFAEGLAIGTSFALGSTSLTAVLVIGFAAHNSTEGFGVVGPALASGVVPSWRRIFALGLIAGGPTILGAMMGSVANAPTLSVVFLGLAAGAILYVVVELIQSTGRSTPSYVRAAGVAAGFIVGLIADLLATAAYG